MARLLASIEATSLLGGIRLGGIGIAQGTITCVASPEVALRLGSIAQGGIAQGGIARGGVMQPWHNPEGCYHLVGGIVVKTASTRRWHRSGRHRSGRHHSRWHRRVDTLGITVIGGIAQGSIAHSGITQGGIARGGIAQGGITRGGIAE
ncbi:hypothetical protein DL93DRAFT_2073992 [Clavulina sp. PMI_390]|nr:hypothetical protein DL93DRAFT_2073992 [Clavulina sp. PMI_390]